MNKKAILCAALLSCGLGIIGVYADNDEQSMLRQNPVLESGTNIETDYAAYKFLNLEENKIKLNGDDWTSLKRKYTASVAGDGLFSIVYLGDSHVQADFGGSVLRKRLSDVSNSAGRGIIIPYKLASTNQPTDYSFDIDCKYVASKLLKLPWETNLSFTGVGVMPLSSKFGINLSCNEKFNRLRFFYHGSQPEIQRVNTLSGMSVNYSVESTIPGELSLITDSYLNDIDILFECSENLTIGGAELLADTAGCVVHSIGNNGATYANYHQIENFGAEISKLNADIIIIALGTNESFGKAGTETILYDINKLVSGIQDQNPSSHIVLVGPAECYKKATRYVRNKNGKYRRIRSVIVNTKVAQVRNIIKTYAAEHGISYYDHYSVAGGVGAAKKMKNAKILSKDGVHYSYDGYCLWGNLLADAILEQISQHR